jgi:hypothetical protein
MGASNIDNLGMNTGTMYIQGTDKVNVAQQNVFETVVTCTMAEVNAGKVIVPAITGKQILVTGYLMIIAGSFNTLTDVRLQSSNATPVVVVTALLAAIPDAAKISSDAVISNVTDGAGFMVALGAGDSLKLVKTGSAATTGTSIKVRVRYQVL